MLLVLKPSKCEYNRIAKNVKIYWRRNKFCADQWNVNDQMYVYFICKIANQSKTKENKIVCVICSKENTQLCMCLYIYYYGVITVYCS